jgi:hypothetical protein
MREGGRSGKESYLRAFGAIKTLKFLLIFRKLSKGFWSYKNFKVLTYFPYLKTSCLFIFH